MTPEEKLQAILNLSCVVMARRAPEADKERAIKLLQGLMVNEAARPWGIIEPLKLRSWYQYARDICANWRRL